MIFGATSFHPVRPRSYPCPEIYHYLTSAQPCPIIHALFRIDLRGFNFSGMFWYSGMLVFALRGLGAATALRLYHYIHFRAILEDLYLFSLSTLPQVNNGAALV